MKLEGGCYCGEVRYKAEGKPMLKAQCHCRECQYISGGSPNMFVLMPVDSFGYTKGTPKKFSRSDLEHPVTREFCAECGTHLITRPAGRGAESRHARRPHAVRRRPDGDLHRRQAAVPPDSRGTADVRTVAAEVKRKKPTSRRPGLSRDPHTARTRFFGSAADAICNKGAWVPAQGRDDAECYLNGLLYPPAHTSST